MKESPYTNRLLWLALALGLIFHGTTLFFTFDQTYDGFVHMFFADHYAKDWFDNWDYRWYTGFTVTSYPPLIHQVIALFSMVIGLKLAFVFTGCIVVVLFLHGVYVFSRLFVDDEIAIWAVFLAIICPSVVEALHIFGQLPSMCGISLVLNATPLVYAWTRTGKWIWLFGAFVVLAATSSAHHVSTIFGMVFFLLPVMGTAVIDLTRENVGSDEAVKWRPFLQSVIKVLPRAIIFGMGTIAVVLIMVLPYWSWSHSDPITQVPIPHGSRDSFIDVPSSGMVFFLIPWGIMLLSLPFFFKHVFTKRNIFLALAIGLGFLLGTGGTTPLPRLLLGDTAFDILTLDRFTFWATLLSIPFWALFVFHLFRGEFGQWIVNQFGTVIYSLGTGVYVILAILSTILIVNLTHFRPLQPQSINVKPITQFLERDGHDNWRYLTLGFGDQMAWLSANTHAMTVDGNYHSVRRLPELTTRAVERLENSKYRGVEGLGALQDFLGNPNKYHLKFLFNNDKFYEPLLYFYGWNRVQQLDNNIVVWERPNVPPLPNILYRKNIPTYQMTMWGVLPLTAVFLCLIFFILLKPKDIPHRYLVKFEENLWSIHFTWIILFCSLFAMQMFSVGKSLDSHHSPENLIQSYYHALDFKEFNVAYELFSARTQPSLEQYILDLSLQEGILSSYAKLDELSIERVDSTNSGIRVKVNCTWITSLQQYQTSHIHYLEQVDNKWYMDYPTFDKSVIPQRYLSRPSVDFYSSGKRKSEAGKSFKEDKIERPTLCASNISVVQVDSSIHVIGYVKNTSPYPAHLSIQASMYDDNNKLINKNSATHILTPRLLPGQDGPFRIDFRLNGDNQDVEFQPSHHPAHILDRIPSSCKLSFTSTITDQVPYINIQNNTKIEDNRITGSLINTGSESIAIPQLLVEYYNDDKLTWVDVEYLENGITPLKKSTYDIPQRKPDNLITLIKVTSDQISINGRYKNSSRCPQTLIDSIQVKPQGFISTAND